MAVENISGELLTPTSLGGLGGLCPLPIKARVSGLEEKKTVPTETAYGVAQESLLGSRNSVIKILKRLPAKP